MSVLLRMFLISENFMLIAVSYAVIAPNHWNCSGDIIGHLEKFHTFSLHLGFGATCEWELSLIRNINLGYLLCTSKDRTSIDGDGISTWQWNAGIEQGAKECVP